MSSPYVGEIRIFCGNFAPVGWAFCNGALISIAQNSVLFQLIGTTYGGDGVNTYALPNLQSRVAVHAGTSSSGTYILGQLSGQENVTITSQTMPQHTHAAVAQAGEGNAASPVGGYFAASSADQYAATATGTTAVAMLENSGGSLPHNNLQPYLAINYIISQFGVFPSQN